MDSKKRIVKCYCPECNHDTNHEILFTEKESSDDNEDYWWLQRFSIARCLGCDKITYLTETTEEGEVEYDEDGTGYFPVKYTTYPLQKSIAKELDNLWSVPVNISTIYNETIKALNTKSFLLTAAGFRMIIEAVCIENKITGKNLETKINNLCKNGIITKKDRDRLHSIRFMGNDSVHQIKKSDQHALLVVNDIINSLISNLYILDNECIQALEGPITNFTDFIELLNNGIKSKKVGDIDILRNLLPKDRRLIKEDLNKFESTLQESINKGEYDLLSICKIPTNGRNQQYKIEKLPPIKQ